LESCCPPPVLCMDQFSYGVDNSVTVSQGAGQPFGEIAKRLLPLTPKARASVGADGSHVVNGQVMPQTASAATIKIASRCRDRNQKLRTQPQRQTNPNRIAANPTTTNAT